MIQYREGDLVSIIGTVTMTLDNAVYIKLDGQYTDIFIQNPNQNQNLNPIQNHIKVGDLVNGGWEVLTVHGDRVWVSRNNQYDTLLIKDLTRDIKARDALQALIPVLQAAKPEEFCIQYTAVSNEPRSRDLYPYSPEPEQGSVRDVFGFGPKAGIKAFPHETWGEYEDRVFNLPEDVSDWINSTAWKNIDNTPQGAAKRIEQYLNHGLPSNWEEQLLGKDKYMFA